MKKIEHNFIFLLSDPAINGKDMTKFYNWLKKGGLEKCYNEAKKIRQIVIESENYKEARVHRSVTNYQQKVIYEIDNILRKESSMTAKDAINALRRELKITIPSNKRSFLDQMLYLTDNIDGSVLINVAHKIRNTETHNVQRNDWPLKE